MSCSHPSQLEMTFLSELRVVWPQHVLQLSAMCVTCPCVIWCSLTHSAGRISRVLISSSFIQRLQLFQSNITHRQGCHAVLNTVSPCESNSLSFLSCLYVLTTCSPAYPGTHVLVYTPDLFPYNLWSILLGYLCPMLLLQTFILIIGHPSYLGTCALCPYFRSVPL